MSHVVKKVTPILYVEAIEPCLGFWEKLGWTRTIDVPEGDRLGFAILAKDGVEIMYQTRASIANDIPAMADSPMRGTFLFIEVSDLDAVIAALGNAPVTFPRRKTFYGMDEIGVREPGGNAVTFAKPT